MLSKLTTRRAEKEAAIDERMAALEREATDAEARLRGLYGLVEDGITETR
jgi:site-specific DNA recombinase